MIKSEFHFNISTYVKVIFVFIALSTLLPLEANAQSAKEAVLALKKLQTRIQAGVTYRDYSNFVADAVFPVKLFIESQDSKEYVELAVLMKKITERYAFAGEVWNWKLDNRFESTVIGTNDSLFSQIRNEYPGVPLKLDGTVIKPDDALRIIWSKASTEVDEAAILFAKEDTKLQRKVADIEALRAENITLKNNVDSLNKEMSQLKEENEKLKRENEQIKSELGSVKSKKSQNKKR